jgi:hypothetical protein
MLRMEWFFYLQFLYLFNRYLKHVGYDVTYVRNFTDIDDKVAYAKSFWRVSHGTVLSVDFFRCVPV